MPVQRMEPTNATLPSAFPEGWYFVASRKDLEKAKIVRKTWMGTEIVAWSDEDGRVCVAEAYCPHLGSDLGPSVGGRVRDGRLVCPFHGFEYDTTGQCVATPYAPAPKAARLRVFESREIAGWSSLVGHRAAATQWHCHRRGRSEGWSAVHIWVQALPATPRRPRRTPWTWPTCATSTATTA